MSKEYDTPTRLANAKDRGAADFYYGKPAIPCIWLNRLGTNVDYDLSAQETRVYRNAFQQAELQDARKEWDDKGPLN